MRGRGLSRLVELGSLLALIVSATLARGDVPRWLLGGSRVEADPQKPYTLKESNGPWLIMACSFSGPNAEQQAHELALELRKKYKLEAFVHKAEFKLDKLNEDRDQNPLSPSNRYKWKYKKFKDRSEFDEFAVLVGNYKSVDDPQAKKTLQELRHAEPECLKVNEGKGTSRALGALRTIQQAILPDGSEKKNRGPMGHAFVTTNPLLPADYYAPNKGIDELVLKMNKDVTHSLLDCPGRYTVQVAHFTGKVVINQQEIEAIENGREMQSSLTQAALKAHVLTEALRMKG